MSDLIDYVKISEAGMKLGSRVYVSYSDLKLGPLFGAMNSEVEVESSE